MVTIPASATVPEGLTLTVGQITWTTRSGGLTTTASEETQIQSEITSSPTTRVTAPSARPPFPLYKGKKIDCSDLLQAIDRTDSKLLEASQLVDGILRQPDQVAPTDFFQIPPANSCRYTRTTENVSDNNLNSLRTIRHAQG